MKEGCYRDRTLRGYLKLDLFYSFVYFFSLRCSSIVLVTLLDVITENRS